MQWTFIQYATICSHHIILVMLLITGTGVKNWKNHAIFHMSEGQKAEKIANLSLKTSTRDENR